MHTEFIIYRRFNTLEIAQEIAQLFNDHNIETRIGDNVAPVDVTFSTGRSATDQVEIRIKQADFQRADILLEKEAEKDFEGLDPKYYLFSFTDKELYDILIKSDEWNIFDYTLAKKILKDRNNPVNDEMFYSIKKQRLEDLAKPEENQMPWIASGYILSLLGGFFGIIIGYMLWTQKKTLPNGTKVYAHKKKDRIHGQQIMVIGIIAFVMYLILQFGFLI